MSTPRVLHVESGWLVLEKPAGWHCVAGATDDGRVVETWLRAERPSQRDLPEAGLCHRLDRDTSGCLVVATTQAACETLARRFRDGTGVRKWYLARVRGGIPAEGAATLSFTSRHKGSAKVTVAEHGDVRHAGRFRWRLLQRGGDSGDLVELELIGPGRRHELRAGCAHLGHALVGDVLYGGALSGGAATHLCLHAVRVEIDGVVVEAPPPEWGRRASDVSGACGRAADRPGQVGT